MLYDILNDMFSLWNIAGDPKLIGTDRVQNTGLRGLISKPHNLYTIKDENGEITEWKMELVYTPFKKEDISVKISDNVLSVEIGTENKEKDKDMVYQGISNQYSKFSLALSDKIDVDNITAKPNEGILEITMPVKKAVEKIERVIPLA